MVEMITDTSLNGYADVCHKENEKWWKCIATGKPIERDKAELFMLMVSEISEAMEGARKNKMDDKLPHRKMEEVEMADALIRIFDYAGGFLINLDNYYPNRRPKEPLSLNDYVSATSIPRYRGIKKGALMMDIVIELSEGAQAAKDHFHEIEACSLANALFLIFAYASEFGLDLHGAFTEKIEFNRHREDHKHEARRKADGKKF